MIPRPFLKHDLQAYIFSPTVGMANHRLKLHEERETPPGRGNVPGSNRKRKPRKSPTERYHTTSYGRAIVRACEIAFGMPSDFRSTYSERPKTTDTAEEIAAKAQRRKEKAVKRRAWHKEHCWHPHQLRHSAGTRLRKDFGLEAAQVILGHRTLSVTQVYAEKNVEAAMKIMGEVG